MDNDHENTPDLNNVIDINEYKNQLYGEDMSYVDITDLLECDDALKRYIEEIDDESVTVEVPGVIFAEILKAFIKKEED